MCVTFDVSETPVIDSPLLSFFGIKIESFSRLALTASSSRPGCHCSCAVTCQFAFLRYESIFVCVVVFVLLLFDFSFAFTRLPMLVLLVFLRDSLAFVVQPS